MNDTLDDDMRRAIELSLRELPPRELRQQQPIIDVDADDDNDEEARFRTDMQRAIEVSKQDALLAASVTHDPAPKAAPLTGDSPATTSFLSERAQMERERLERQKRRRPDIDSGANRPSHHSDDETDGQSYSTAKRQRVSSSLIVGSCRTNASTSASSSYQPSISASGTVASRPPGATEGFSQSVFWDGELRQTANKHVESFKDTRPVFRLSEIIGPKDDIQFAIVSAFCWNFPWVYQMFSRSTPVIAVDHSPSGDASIKAILPNWIRTTPFLRNGFGCMHMKFMLLFYKTGRLRVVVSTANLIEYDWRDIENSVWVQDIPKRSSPFVPPSDTEDFASSMVRVLHALNAAPALVNLLRNDHPNLPLQRLEDLRSKWDFSNVRAALVPSIAGKHEGWPKVILTGHTRLMKALLDMHAATPQDKDLLLECQGSSIGNYSSTWLNEIYRSARGESAERWLKMPKANRAKLPLPPIQILFPTTQYVRDSKLGEAGGGTMFCRRKQWEGANFPRELFHQTRSKRGRVLMHSKMILGTFRDKQQGTLVSDKRASEAYNTGKEREGGSKGHDADKTEPPVGWVYVGSHNFTPSAWGTLSGSGFTPTLNINNYELGVVIPLCSQEEIERVACWERPAPKYARGRDEPWMQTESAYFVEDA
ncbi:tyrosyl-DNA phosphodiesterase-domain-containing protein [Trametes meyenii]|nr:tyrosyl-DNA phosphodiesterase-domain-containing protein [Trametes meyenii]